MPRTADLYFDNSVLEAIASQAAGSPVKSLLKGNGLTALGSIQNLTETLRIEDDEKRVRLVRAILQVARNHEVDPLEHRVATALIGQIRTHHPDWVNPTPNLKSIRENLSWFPLTWERLKNDPLYRPRGLLSNRRLVQGNIAESLRRQRAWRQTRLKGEPLATTIIDPDGHLIRLLRALPPLEAHWRERWGASTWSALMKGDRMVLDLREWLAPYVLTNRLDPESWLRFWLVEADAGALAVRRVQGLTAYFQAELGKITAGNAGDINHAGYALEVKYFLTADKTFYGVLKMVAQQPNVEIAQPVLIDRAAADICAEIGSSVGW
jgi:hypothetical protein